MNLNDLIKKNNIPVPDDFSYKIQIYKEHLFKWNKTHNLTGAKDEKTIDEFIVDSLFVTTFLPTANSILDIGSGAGFPGIMLALALPNTKITLAEPLKKRAAFLQFIKADLKLTNIDVKNCRVQEIKNQKFDIITSRAVSDTAILINMSLPLSHQNTKLLFFKGENVYNEVNKKYNYEIIKTKKRHYLLIDSVKGDKNV